jgi:hypothetical protein
MSLKMSSKSLNFIENVFKKPQISYQSLHFSENVFKKPLDFYRSFTVVILQNPPLFLKRLLKASKSCIRLGFFEKHHFKKALIPLKMFLKSPLIN